MKECGKIL